MITAHLSLRSSAPLALRPGDFVSLNPAQAPQGTAPQLLAEELPGFVPAGSILGTERGNGLLQVTGLFWLPSPGAAGDKCYWATALDRANFDTASRELRIWKQGFSLAWITLSDKGARGERTDGSGPIIPGLVSDTLPVCLSRGYILPDDACALQGLLTHLALTEQTDIILTSGGTGVTSRDVAPDATLAVIDRRLHGFEQAMTATSMAKTPHGIISRAVAGVAGRCLIVNLPGSPKAVRENLGAVLPALAHTLEKLHDDPRECGSS
jgi:molybdenum cofactor synthesis domain-containing protein